MAKFGCKHIKIAKLRQAHHAPINVRGFWIALLCMHAAIAHSEAKPQLQDDPTQAVHPSAAPSAEQRFYIELPPASIAISLNRVAQQTGASVLFSFEQFSQLPARPVIGWLSVDQALAAMLKDTGFQAVRTLSGIYRLERLPDILPQPPATISTSDTIQETTPIEEVWVRGYRDSLHSALAIKRQGTGISDSIHQEDIGKFPDNNIAEALQRLTGVAIERNGGEGQFITVRGFGPEFNRVLMNGRQLATDNQERGFSLDIIPADLITRADILKTQSASLSAGSIGATLNLHTPKFADFDSRGGQFRGRFEMISQPQAHAASRSVFFTTGAASDTQYFDINAVAAINLSERNRQREGFTTEGFRQADQVTIVDTHTGQTTIEHNVFIPRSYRVYRTQDTRDQQSATFNINIESNEHWQIPWQWSIDGFTSRYQTLAKTGGMQAYFEDNFSELTLDNTRTAIAFTRLGTDSLNALNLGQSVSAQGVDAIAIDQLRDTTTYLLGSRFQLELDHWHSTFDISQSEAKHVSGGNPFSAQGFISDDDAHWQFNGDLNRAPDFYVSPFPTANALKAHFLGRFDGDTQDRIQAFDWSNTVTHHWLGASEWQGGIHFEKRFKRYTHLEIPYPRNCAYCGRINSFSDDTLSQLGLQANDVFNGVNLGHSFAGGLAGDYPKTWYEYDIDTLITILESDAFIEQGPLDSAEVRSRLDGLGFSAEEQPASYQVAERIRNAYIEASWEGEADFLTGHHSSAITQADPLALSDYSWQFTLGSQYSHTTTTNYGIEAPIENISRANDDDQLNITYGALQNVSEQQVYEVWLPFVTASLRAGSHVLRAAYNHSITRPNLQDLGKQTQIVPRAGSANVFQGNVALRPYRTQNYDGAYEYYFANKSFAGLNLFYKKMDRFISQAVTKATFGDYTLHINSAQNQERAHIYGAEIAFIHHFGKGFGAQFNHTWVQSSADFSEQKDFAIEGLSPRSLNFIGFIERPNYALRLSYNWRADYLQERFNAQSQPQHSLAYGQWDFSSQWHLSDHAHINFDVQNLTNERQHYYSIYPARVISAEHIGRVFSLGLTVQTSLSGG